MFFLHCEFLFLTTDYTDFTDGRGGLAGRFCETLDSSEPRITRIAQGGGYRRVGEMPIRVLRVIRGSYLMFMPRFRRLDENT
jgi:hypothetical protein